MLAGYLNIISMGQFYSLDEYQIKKKLDICLYWFCSLDECKFPYKVLKSSFFYGIKTLFIPLKAVIFWKQSLNSN